MPKPGADALIGLGLGLAAGLACYAAWQLVDLSLLQTYDLWFEGDLERVYRNMTERWSDHQRSNVHPLFSLFTIPVAYGLKGAFGLTPFETVRLMGMVLAGVWVASLYVLLRLLGCRRLDATLFAVLGAVSSAAIFWFTVPETYALGSLTIVVALIVAALATPYALGETSHVLASALTLSVTVTNWMAGLAATFVRFPWRRALQISVNAFFVVTVLWGIQKTLIPSAKFFLGENEEHRWMAVPALPFAGQAAAVLLLHSVVMPEIAVVPHPEAIRVAGDRFDAICRALTIQAATLGSADLQRVAGTLIWAVLLGLGFWALATGRADPRVRLAIGVCLIGQLGLHVIYGPETFLYTLNILPLLVATAALATLTRARPIVLGLCLVLLLIAATHNAAAFQRAIQLARSLPHVTTPTLPDVLSVCRQDVDTEAAKRFFPSQ